MVHFKKRGMDAASWLLVVVCAACSVNREGAPNRPVQAPRIGSAAGSPSATPASPALHDPPSRAETATNHTESPEKRACVWDDECTAPDFCDRGVCATPGKALYGRDECEPDPPPPPKRPPPPPGMRWGAPSDASDCGSYRCIDGRCRSCKTDAECGEGLACKSWTDMPGKSCGRPGPELSHVPSSSPQTPPPMPPILGAGVDETPDPSGRQKPVPSDFPGPPPPPKPSK
jgi:hypothetical protein